MKQLTDQEIKEIALEFGIEYALIRAVMEVESSGGGFNSDGSLKIKFEGHIFYKLLPNRLVVCSDKQYNDICYPKWTEKFTKNQTGEYTRLTKAIAINSIVAWDSVSMGLFQTMGFNAKLCGFKNALEMRNAYMTGERAQLVAFIRFLNNRKIIDLLKTKRFDLFAKAYNGANYEKNKYDLKVQKAYDKWKQ